MNRGDLRLIVAILGTAVLSSIVTVVVHARMTVTPTMASDPRLEALETRVRALEADIAELPDPPDTDNSDNAAVVEPAPDPCDEVACVLSNYEAACCAAFEKPHGRPEGLDRQLISAGVAAVKADIQACGDRSTAKGLVKVAVKVAPDGHAAAVTIKESPDDKLGACVAKAMARATFAPTQTGGSFSYPFVF